LIVELDRLYPFGAMYADIDLQFTDRDDGYVQIALDENLLFGAVYYNSLYVSRACCYKSTKAVYV